MKIYYENPSIAKTIRNEDLHTVIEFIKRKFIATEVTDFDALDTRDLMVLLDFIRSDDGTRIGSLLEKREKAVASYEFDIVSSDDSIDTYAVKECLEDLIYKIIELPTEIAAYGQSLIKLSPNRENYEYNTGGLIGLNFEKIYQTEFKRYDGNTAGIFESRGAKFNVVNNIANGGKFNANYEFLYAQDKNRYSGGILKQLALFAILIRSNYMEWVNYNRKMKGLIGVKYSINEVFESVRDEMRSMGMDIVDVDAIRKVVDERLESLANMGTDEVSLYPPGVDVERNDLNNSFASTSFSSLITALDKVLGILILGQNSTTDQPNVGSFASFKVISTATKDIEYTDKITIKNLMKHVLRYFWFVNFGTYDCKLRFAWNEDELQDIDQNVRTLSAIARLGIKNPDGKNGIELNKLEFYRKIGFSAPKHIKNSDIIIIGESPSNQFGLDLSAEEEINNLE